MSALTSLLERFHSAILDNESAPLLPDIRPHPHLTPAQQMAIYSDGYRTRLTQAIRSDYPALLALIGDEAFAALALKYIEKNPPHGFNLDRYPHGFSAFVREYSDDAFVADLAALEDTIAQVFMLPDSAALTPAALSGITPESFGDTVLKLRAASQLLALDYPADLYRENPTPQKQPAEKIYLFLIRHDNEVKRHRIAFAEFLILSALQRGMNVGTALESIAEKYPQLVPEIAQHMQAWFGSWTHNGFFEELS